MTDRTDTNIVSDEDLGGLVAENKGVAVAQTTATDEQIEDEKTAEEKTGENAQQGQVTAAVNAQATIPIEKIETFDTTAVKQTLTATEGVPIELPEGADVTGLFPFQNDLIIQEADGSLIYIIGGAIHPPTLIIGQIEIASADLSAAFSSGSLVIPAAGPDGPEQQPSSGGNFARDPGIVGDPLNPVPLLPPTAFDRQFEDIEEFEGLIEDDPTPLRIVSVVPERPTVNDPGLLDEDGVDIDRVDISIQAGSSDVVDLRFGPDLSGITVVGADPNAEFIWTIVPGNGSHIIQGSLVGDGVVITLEIGLDGPIPDGRLGTGEIEITLLEGFPHAPGDGNATITNIPIVAEDADGNTDDATTQVDVVDSVPVAMDDENSVPAGSFETIAGNVIEGGSAGDVADDIGADDGTTTGMLPQIVSISHGGTTSAVEDAPVTIAGDYGELTIYPDGSYEYTRNPNTPGGVEDVFTYTLRDGDTDTDTATLTIDIGNVPPTIRVPEPDGEGSDVVVDEDELPDGSDASGNTDDSNVFFISSPDGIASLTIGGVEVITNGVFTATSFTTPEGNTLSIDSYDPNTGQIGYTYTLNDNEAHPDAGGQNSIFEDFAIVLTDLDGQTANATLTAEIIDDVPDAVDDVAGQASENDPVIVDVFSNDTAGADGVNLVSGVEAVAGSLTGVGSLVYNDDGTFTYTPAAGEEGSVSFDYRITDSDGDTDIATVTIRLQEDSEPQVGEAQNLVVDEDGLPGANDDTVTSRNDETDSTESTMDTGTVTVNFGNDVPADLAASIVLVDTPALDGQLQTHDGFDVVFSLDSNGDLVGTAGAGGREVIRIELTTATAGAAPGEVDYGYKITLSEDLEHPAGNLENSDNLTGITFEVTDSDGDMAQGTFNASVIDDVPEAVDDVVVGGEDTTITVNVLTNDLPGADSPAQLISATTSTAGVTITSIDADGNITVDPDAGFEGDAVINYTIVDQDGDTSSATLTITFPADSVPELKSVDPALVDEDGLTDANVDGVPLRTGEVDSTESATTTGQIVIDFKSLTDVPANLLAAIELLDTAGLDGQLQTLGMVDVVFALEGGALVGRPSGGGDPVITIEITGVASVVGTEVTYEYQVTLHEPVKHLGDDTEDTITLNGVRFQVTDADGSMLPAPGMFDVSIVDDIPLAQITLVDGAMLVVDETAGIQNDGSNSNETGTGGGLGQATILAASLFTDTSIFGADGGAAVDDTVYSLNITSGAATGLVDTATGQPISLFDNGGVVEGRNIDGDVVFTIAVAANGDVTLTQLRAVVHGDPGDHDEADTPAVLGGGYVELVVTVTDGDGDQDDASIDLGGVFKFEDDGPTLTVSAVAEDGNAAAALALNVDETDDAAGVDRYADGETPDDGNPDGNEAAAGLGQVTTTIGVGGGGLTSLFTIGGDFGSDGMGSDSGSLSFVFSGGGTGPIATSLTATDGGAIVLELSGDGQTIIGRDTADNSTVFTIAIVDVGGDLQVQLTQNEAVEHPTNTMFDEAVSLLLDAGVNGAVQLQYEVTRTDADGDSVTVGDTIDLIGGNAPGGSFFSFDDDGPTLTVVAEAEDGQAAAALALNVDETDDAAGSDRYADGETPDDANPDGNAGAATLGQVTTAIGVGSGGLLSLFTVGGDFGSDGAADSNALVGSLSFVFPTDGAGVPLDLATKLTATNGGAIVLELSGDGQTIIGRDTADNSEVFSIAIVDVGGELQLQLTQNEAIEHPTTTTFDEAISLLLGANVVGAVQLQYEVTRTDGDGDDVTVSDTIDLIGGDTPGGSFFSFDDDGPTLTVTAETGAALDGLALNVDETFGEPDRENSPGETADGNDDENPGDGFLGQQTTAIGTGVGGLASLFAIAADAGSDGETSLTGAMSFVFTVAGSLGTNLLVTDTGNGIELILSPDGQTITGQDDTNGSTVFTIAIVDVGGGELQLQLTQFQGIVHGDNALFDEIATLLLSGDGAVQLQYEVTLVDGDNDSIVQSDQIDLITSQSSYFTFDDDGPTLTVTAQADAADQLVLEVDETVGADRYNTGEAEDADGNANTDDGAGFLGQVTTNITGVDFDGLRSLFDVVRDSGSDGIGSQSRAFSFVGVEAGTPVATQLSATDGGDIDLVYVSDTQVNGVDQDGDTVFTLAIVDVGGGVFQLQLTVFEAIHHGDDGNLYDHEIPLLLTNDDVLQLQFTFSVTDGDGDSLTRSDVIDLASATTSVFSFDDDGPINNLATESMTVHEDALDNFDAGYVGPGIEGSKGNDEGGKTTTATFTYAMIAALVNFGSDGAGAITLNTAITGNPIAGVTSKGLPLTWNVVSASEVEGVASDGRVIFKITHSTGANALDPSDDTYTFELLDQVDHNTDLGDDDASVVVDIASAFVAADGDGDTVVLDGGLNVAIENDVPTGITADTGVVFNEAGLTFTGDLNFSIGADEPGSIAFANTTTPPDGLQTVSGQNVVYSINGNVLTAYVEGGAPNNASDQVFIVTANLDGTYDFELLQELASFQQVQVGTGNSFGNGPVNAVVVDEQGSTDDLILVTGFSAAGSFVRADWLDGDYALTNNNMTEADVNFSTQSYGVASDNNSTIDPGEILRLDFGTDAFTLPGITFNGPDVNELTVTMKSFKTGESVDWLVVYSDGTTESGTYTKVTGNGTQDQLAIPSSPSKTIDYAEFYSVDGSGQIVLNSVSAADNTGSNTMTFDVTVTDEDGDDLTVDDAISVTVTGSTIMSGTTGDDVLVSGLEATTMTGGGGDDVFVISDASFEDLIVDYDSGDAVDLTALFDDATPGDVSDHVTYDNSNGELTVDGTIVATVEDGGGGNPLQIDVIFDDGTDTYTDTV